MGRGPQRAVLSHPKKGGRTEKSRENVDELDRGAFLRPKKDHCRNIIWHDVCQNRAENRSVFGSGTMVESGRRRGQGIRQMPHFVQTAELPGPQRPGEKLPSVPKRVQKKHDLRDGSRLGAGGRPHHPGENQGNPES